MMTNPGGELGGRALLLRSVLSQPSQLHAAGRRAGRAQIVGHVHSKDDRITGTYTSIAVYKNHDAFRGRECWRGCRVSRTKE